MTAAPPEQGWPTVTAIVPTHNRPVMLRRAVAAILEQEYPGRVECVVVFDKSTPVPLDIDPPAGRSLVLIENHRTPGLAGARNAGVLAASGELVAWCDDDDEWLPGKLAAQVDLLAAEPAASIVATGILVNHRGRDIERLAPSTPTQFHDFLRSRHMEIHPCTFLARRSAVLDTIGLVDEDIPGGYGEDYEWLLRATRSGPVVSVPRALVRIYWHDSSFFAGKWRTISEGLQYLLARYPEFEREPAGLARVQGQIALAHAALGERRRAVTWACRALRRSRRARHAYAALAVSSGAVRADRLVVLARRFGRGV